MEITRRWLWVSMAAVAGAVATRAVHASPLIPTTAPSPLEDLTGEIQWAHAGLMAALEDNDFHMWIVDSDDEKPNRMRLARALVMSRELDLADPLAVTINHELEKLWRALTSPRRHSVSALAAGTWFSDEL
jgi:hypothetical protein